MATISLLRRPVQWLLASFSVRRAYMILRRAPLLGRLVRRVALTVVPPRAQWVVVPQGICRGLHMLVDPLHEIGYLRGDHEAWLQALMARCLQPADTYVDVGAHAGFFSLAAARLVGPTGSVHAFEPDPGTFARLDASARRNGFGWLRTHQEAVWRESGTVFLHSSGERDAGVRSATSAAPDGAPDTIRVPAVRLDDLFAAALPRMIKVDVEGAEVAVLDGAQAILGRGKTCWVIELHGEECERGVLDRLRAAGCAARVIRPTDPVYPSYRQDYVLGLPSEAEVAKAYAGLALSLGERA